MGKNPQFARQADIAAKATRKFLQANNVNPRAKYDGMVAKLSNDLVKIKLSDHEQRFTLLSMIRAEHGKMIGRVSALGVLPREQIIAICLVDGAGCSHKEAARVCAWPETTVRSRLRRARETLRRNRRRARRR